jgi:hypothetical protein
VSTTGDGTKSVSSSTTAVCTVSGLGVSYVGVGTCSLTAHVAAGTNYAAADGNAQTFSVGQATPNAPSITNLPAGGTYGGGFTAAVGTQGDGTTSITSSTGSVCTVSGTSVSYVGAGTCTLTAHVAAGTNYAAADGNPQSFSVSRATPSTPAISNLPASGTVGGGFTATVSTNGDGTTSVTSSTTSVCTASGLSVSYVGVGTCMLTAHVAVGTNYSAADGSTQSFAVAQGAPTTPTITDLPDSGTLGGGFTAVVGTTGDGVASVSSWTPSVCTASGLEVSFVGVGTCILTAHVAAGTNFSAADGNPQGFGVSAPLVAPGISIGDVTVIEGDSGTTNASIPVTLSWPTTKTVTVAYSTAPGTALDGSDYQGSTGTVTFPAKATAETITVPIVGDQIAEKTEKFSVNLASPTNATLADTKATVNILDNDAPISVSVADSAVLEGNTGTTTLPFTLSLSRPAPVGAAVSVTVATADTTATAASGDYVAIAPTVVTFGPGEQTKTVNVTVNGDAAVEKNETLKLALSAPVGAALADTSAVGTIVNDDGPGPVVFPEPSVSAGDTTVIEGDTGTTTASVPVTLNMASTAPVTVSYTTADSSAKAPGDYTPVSGTLTFDPGETSKSVAVPVVGDQVAENAEKLSVKLSAPVGATLGDATAFVNILDDDAPITYTVSDVWVTEGNSGTTNANFTVALSAPVPSGQTVQVTVATVDGSAKASAGDYVTLAPTVLTFSAGEQSQTVTVAVKGDTTVEANETFKLMTTGAVGMKAADSSGVATIANDD